VKYFPGADAPANHQNDDQQSCQNQQADLQSEEGKNQQTYQRKRAHPYQDSKRHIIKVICESFQHDLFLKFKFIAIV